MQWKLTDEQDAYQEAFSGWLAQVAPVNVLRGWLDAGDHASFEQQMAGDGWLGVGLPEQVGGQGGGVVELALTAQELARAGVPSAAWLASTLAISALAGGGPGVTEVVSAALSGQVLALLQPAEAVPGATTGLTVDVDGAVSGTVRRVLAGDRARRFLVPLDGPGGVEVRLVEADADGLQVNPRLLLDRTRSVADITLDGVQSSLLVHDGAADALVRVSHLAAVLTAADALGASVKMLDLSVEYSKQRKQFGVPIGSFQAVKHAAADILVSVEAARSIVYFAAASVEQAGPVSGLHAAAAKAQVTAEAARSADTALTMHGAIGYTWEHELQIYYKRAKLDAQLFGDPVVWNERIAAGLALI